MREMALVPYDIEWKKRFAEISNIIKNALGNTVVDIHHFGSTAIEEMPSKPIIDVLVIVNNIHEVDSKVEEMITCGYVAKGENGIVGRRYFQKLAPDGINHIEHIHCYESGNSHVNDELMFRDYLITNKEAFEKYKSAKIEASEKYRFSPKEYSEYKTPVINEIMTEAKKYYKIENAIRTTQEELQNIYFLWGRGKTTIANILRDRHDFYIYSTDEARDRLMLIADPEKQPYMCRDFESEYGVSSFWELPSEVIADREVHFLEEMTPMIIDELVELSNKYSIIICEGDIDYKQIIGLSTNIVYLQNCGTKFDWFNRPDHDNLDYIRNRTDIDETQKQALIDQAYASVANDENALPDYVTEHNIKVIAWDDNITPEETANDVEAHFDFS